MSDEPLLRIDELSVSYGGVLALDGVSMEIPSGSIVGLIGPNGAGKTTFIDTVTGFTRATRGRVVFEGRDVTAAPPHRRVHAGMVRTFQSLELFEDLTVRANLVVAARTPSWRSTLTDALWPKRHDDPAVDEVLDALDLGAVAERLPNELSNGQRHVVALARALVARPRFVLLDEPAAGLDPSETDELAGHLRLLPERGVTTLVVDHDMALIMGVCDEVHVLDFGQLIASGPPSVVRHDPDVITAYLGAGTS